MGLNNTFNILNYKTEYVDLKQGDGLGKYLALNYYIDGDKMLMSKTYCLRLFKTRKPERKTPAFFMCAILRTV